jgi:hypothetical protein
MGFIPPPIVPKLKNPPPRPDPDLQKPMVTYFRTERKITIPFAVRFFISILIVSVFFAAIFGYAFLCLHQPVIGAGLIIGLGLLVAAFIISYDDWYWS